VPQAQIHFFAAVAYARLLQAYKHDSILPLYCSFVTGQELWMVMPYMEVSAVAASL
jgi:hypothetical protein